jgi:signal transduction histidine kinase
VTGSIRVLIAEASRDDVDLVLRELREGGFAPEHESVQDPQAFEAALDKGGWDLVISDFRMPSFTGLEALEILRQRSPDLPFIIVSGTIGEEIAVDTLKSGANDYVMKDRLGRLVPAVRRELGRRADQARLREKEEQFRQAQKMEAVGRLAGGIAHDFNNVLAVITMYCEMMLSRLSSEDYIARDVEQIKAAADRAAALTRQLLAFSRKQIMEPRIVDLNPVISNLEKMLRRLIGEDVELTCAPGEGLRRIRIDPGQLEQVILNLVVNSRDAMPKGGDLILERGPE